MQRVNQIAEYGSTLQRCHLVPVGQVTILKNSDGDVRYGGLKTCRGSWACPICTPRRAAERAEVVSTIAGQIVNTPVMITYTMQHKKEDGLSPLLDTLTRALRLARNGKRRKAYNDHCMGYIRALEITYGKINGWHPHYHELNFLNRSVTKEQLIDGVVKNYRKAIADSGKVVNDFTVNVKNWDEKTDYLTKSFDMTKELTHGIYKKYDESYNIFEILNNARKEIPNEWNELYLEFVKATHRRKVIVTSRSLDRWRKIAEQAVKDKEQQKEEQDHIVHVFTPSEWSDICRNGLRYEILVTLND